MVLVWAALLEKETTGGIENENREGTMEPSFDVGPELLGRAERPAVLINQYDFTLHGPRSSFKKCDEEK